MYETREHLEALQQLLDDSFSRSSEHLLSIMEPHRHLSAERIVAEMPSPAVLNVATVTARGEPRISAVDGHFLYGKWHFGTATGSPKDRHLTARPATSASYAPRDGYGVFCHGQAIALAGDERQRLLEHLAKTYGTEPDDWADGSYYRIDAHWMTGFALTDQEVAEVEAHRSEHAG